LFSSRMDENCYRSQHCDHEWPGLILSAFGGKISKFMCRIWDILSDGSELLIDGNSSIRINGGILPLSRQSLTVLTILYSLQCYLGISPLVRMDQPFEYGFSRRGVMQSTALPSDPGQHALHLYPEVRHSRIESMFSQLLIHRAVHTENVLRNSGMARFDEDLSIAILHSKYSRNLNHS